MDFDTILYILLMVGWLGITVFKNLKKDEAERTAHKNRPRPIVVETTDETETAEPQKKTSKKKAARQQAPQEEQYFSYETMSDRDFASEFGQSAEETVTISDSPAPHPAVHLNMDEEEVYKGIVWSEILRRKY
ncbi:MAG: hypothetical protein K5885_07610 [Bacteroidales bacterium]|nr:hypothetical protein [Bacteroidales bacterium]